MEKTLVYQSFRTDHHPPWIGRCLASVKQWAREHGMDYQFQGDEFLDVVGQDYASCCRGSIFLLSDYARLVVAKRGLERGYARVIWLDADIFVFAPSEFVPFSVKGDLFCEERYWWVPQGATKALTQRKVSNALMIFSQGSKTLDLYLRFCEGIVKSGLAQRKQLTRLGHVRDLGPDFLTQIDRARPLNVIREVLHFMPGLLEAMASGGGRLLEQFLSEIQLPMFAAHLTHSAVGRVFAESTINALMDELETGCGRRLSQHAELP